MSTEKDSPPSVNDDNEVKFDYSYPVGRLSPSSWDDSNEEFSDEDSCSTVDRRQSLARVKRRKRSIRSPVLDKDSSNEFVAYSGRAVISPDISPVHQSWNDSDSEEIISGIENYLNKKRLSLIRSKIPGNQSKIDECVSVFNGKVTNQNEIFSGVDFDSNLNCKLSKIVEVEEKSNGSLGNRENPPSAVPLCFQTNNKFVDRTADAMTNFSYYDTSGINNEDNQRVASTEYSSRDGFRGTADENDLDDWQRIKSEIKREIFDYAMTCEESEYVSSSLNFMFDKKVHEKPTNNEEVDVKHGNETYVDGINRIGEKEKESMSPNLPERILHNIPSKETVDFGPGKLFHTGVQDDFSVARSGREAFLVRVLSGGWNSPTISKRVHGNHIINLSKSEKVTNYLTETDCILYFDEDWERNQRDLLVQQNNLLERDDSCSSSKTEQFNFADKNLISNNEHGNNSRQSSPDSFRSKILLDLNSSDNDEKCSTIERLVFGDSPDDVNKLREAGNLENETWSLSKDAPITNNMAMTEKPESGITVESYKGNTHIHPYDCHQLGIGDSKWNSDETIRRTNFPQDRGDIIYERPETEPTWGKLITTLERSYPSRRPKETVFWVDLGQNRQSHDLKSTEIFRTETINVNYPYTSIVHKKKARCKRTKPRKRKRESVGQPLDMKSENQWGSRLFDQRGNWLVNTVTRHEDVLTRGKRWFQALIITQKRSRRPYRHKWHSSTPTSHGDSKFIDCFCNLFKQIVNVFTVSRKSRK